MTEIVCPNCGQVITVEEGAPPVTPERRAFLKWKVRHTPESKG